MRYIIFFGFIVFMSYFVSCSVNKNSLKGDINASLKMDYYDFPKETKFLYKNKLYSQKDFSQKYNITAFEEVEIIQDKKAISKYTNDPTCRVILKVVK